MRYVCFALVGVIVLGLAGPAESQLIKLGTLAPEGSPWYTILRDMETEWGKATGGQVTFRIYPGGVAGDEADMLRKIRIGQLHAAGLSSVGLSRIIPEIYALQLPLMYATYEELDYVRDRLGPHFEKLLQEKGFIVLNWADGGWVKLFSQEPVVKPQDLLGQKIFVWTGETATFSTWKEAGYHPVELAATDILPSLQTGLINVFNTTPLAALSFQWFALARNMSDLNWAPLIGATIITKRQWEKIPADVRSTLREIAWATGERLKREIRKLDQEAVRVMKTHGLVVHTIPPEFMPAWQALAEIAYQKLIEGGYITQDMIEEVRRLRDEYRAQQKAAGKE